MIKVNLSTEKAKELAQNPKFMEELSSVINDEEKCLNLFKKYGIEFSKEEFVIAWTIICEKNYIC